VFVRSAHGERHDREAESFKRYKRRLIVTQVDAAEPGEGSQYHPRLSAGLADPVRGAEAGRANGLANIADYRDL
jgi:hypothetical protein